MAEMSFLIPLNESEATGKSRSPGSVAEALEQHNKLVDERI